MCVAAHPDDEDGSTLTVLRRKYGVHTVSLFSTFGEGGQNAVGPELYEELGVIRARETMAAAEVQGSEPHFLGFRDFGFSKSAEETFRAWGEKRNAAPHGAADSPASSRCNHHQSRHDERSRSSPGNRRTVLQAFDAAADPKQFPEQLAQAGTWQVQRLFVRSRGRRDAPARKLITLDPNETDPVRGTTYAQQALSGLHKHATQGPWPKTVPAGRRASDSLQPRQTGSESRAALPANAKTPVDGLTLPEAVASKLVAPTIESKPLTEFIDRRLEVLVSLLNAQTTWRVHSAERSCRHRSAAIQTDVVASR